MWVIMMIVPSIYIIHVTIELSSKMILLQYLTTTPSTSTTTTAASTTAATTSSLHNPIYQ